MYLYYQRSGDLFHGETFIANCFSGAGEHRNDPLSQHLVGLGPIPQGAYMIGAPTDNPKFVQPALHLLPLTGTEVYGRSGFLLHGGTESHGCIIADHASRVLVAESHDKLLLVLPGDGPRAKAVT